MILGVLWDRHGLAASQILRSLFEKTYSGRLDYYKAIEEVWGPAERSRCTRSVNEAEAQAGDRMAGRSLMKRLFFGSSTEGEGDRALLLAMPEPDFRLAIERALAPRRRMGKTTKRINEVCHRRGSSWIFKGKRFVWVGNELVEKSLMQPAEKALDDSRFGGGARSEFESARTQLRAGTGDASKQAVREAANAVESAMKVLLEAHGIPYKGNDAAKSLFAHLVAGEIVPEYMEHLVLAPCQIRNRAGGHGAGAVPHQVTTEQAEAAVGGAAGALSYLGRLLPRAKAK